MHILKAGEPLSPLFKRNTVLWRSVGFRNTGRYFGGTNCEIHDMKFEKTERGSYLGRVQLAGGCYDFIHEPVVMPPRGDYGEIVGLVVFIDKPVPENWTHLLVTGVSNVMRSPWNPETTKLSALKGAAIFATPAKP